MWLLRWRTGLAMTVLVGAMQADSRGRVVGRGRGDCSCFTVVSYTVREDSATLLLEEIKMAQNKCVCTNVNVYLLAFLQKKQKLHANRGDPPSLGSMKAAVGQKHPQQSLVLPQPGLASL